MRGYGAAMNRISRIPRNRWYSGAPSGDRTARHLNPVTDEFSTLYICVRDRRVDEFWDARSRSRDPCLNGWVVDQSHALMGFWYFLRSPASPKIPASDRKHQQHQRRWLRHGAARKRAVARCLAEVCTPHVVVALRVSRAESFAPHNIVGGIDNTVAVKIAGNNRPSAEVPAPQIVLCRDPLRVLGSPLLSPQPMNIEIPTDFLAGILESTFFGVYSASHPPSGKSPYEALPQTNSAVVSTPIRKPSPKALILAAVTH